MRTASSEQTCTVRMVSSGELQVVRVEDTQHVTSCPAGASVRT